MRYPIYWVAYIFNNVEREFVPIAISMRKDDVEKHLALVIEDAKKDGINLGGAVTQRLHKDLCAEIAQLEVGWVLDRLGRKDS